MAKIVYNTCYGGFSVSEAAVARLRELGVEGDDWELRRELPRHDPRLVQVVEELGKAANGPAADLAIEEIPSGSKYRIDEYDGAESVQTPNSYKWSVAP